MTGSVVTAVADSFPYEEAEGIHIVGTDVFKAVLIKANPTGTYDHTFTNYSQITANGDEASGAGYTAGGVTLSGVTLALQSGVTTIDWSTITIPASTLSACGVAIINSSKSGRGVATFSFGGVVSDSNGNFVITSPTSGPTTSLIRL